MQVGLSPEVLRARVVSNPTILGYSLDGRLRPRLAICEELGLPAERFLFSYHSRSPESFLDACYKASERMATI